MDSDEYDHGNDNCQKDPPAQLNALFKISNTGCHWSTINESRFSIAAQSARSATFAGLTAPAPGADRRPQLWTSGRDAALPQIPEYFPWVFLMQGGPTPDSHGRGRCWDSGAAIREIGQSPREFCPAALTPLQ